MLRKKYKFQVENLILLLIYKMKTCIIIKEYKNSYVLFLKKTFIPTSITLHTGERQRDLTVLFRKRLL